MNSINLLPKKTINEGKILATRKWVYMVTSIVLTVYIVIAAGIVGWWLFVAGIDNLTARELASLQEDIRKNSSVESLIWQADSRQKMINTFISNKNTLSGITSDLIPLDEGLFLEAWEYKNATQLLSGKVQQVDQLEKYTERIKAKFPGISIATLSTQNSSDWVAEIKL